jgi:HAD superfamily hydrolase (TIGR01509 family)
VTVSCFLVDLDDTLYAETDYVDSGYRAIAPLIAEAAGVPVDEALMLLRYEFRKFGRTGAFDRVLKTLGASSLPVGLLVEAYREHVPDIAFYPQAEEALARLSSVAPVAIVTDGTPAMQRRKVAALGLDTRVDAVVYCWECQAPKPEVGGYLQAAAALGVDPARASVVGDDPFHDMAAAHALGVGAARVRTGRLGDLDHPMTGVTEYASFAAFADAIVR